MIVFSCFSRAQLLSAIFGRKLSLSHVLSLKFLPLLSLHTLIKVDTTYLYLSFNIRGWAVSWSRQIPLPLLLTFLLYFPHETVLSFVFSSLVYVPVMYKQGQVTQIPAPYPPRQKEKVPGDPSSFSSHTVTLFLSRRFKERSKFCIQLLTSHSLLWSGFQFCYSPKILYSSH